ncbi:hypothetical protein HDE_10007 [Halotydeus destructor]|nr:hypothetical protein HDE_10007 [Halotydeus destructor]
MCNASGSDSATTSSMDNGTVFSGTPEPKGSTCSRSEIHYPTIHNPDTIYETKRHRKLIRFVTVIAYIFAVSLAAIVLSLYYFFLWDPYMQPNSFVDPNGNVIGPNSNAAFFPGDNNYVGGGGRSGRKRLAAHGQPRTVAGFGQHHGLPVSHEQHHMYHPPPMSGPPGFQRPIYYPELPVAMAMNTQASADKMAVNQAHDGIGPLTSYERSTENVQVRSVSTEDSVIQTTASGPVKLTSAKPLALWLLQQLGNSSTITSGANESGDSDDAERPALDAKTQLVNSAAESTTGSANYISTYPTKNAESTEFTATSHKVKGQESKDGSRTDSLSAATALT